MAEGEGGQHRPEVHQGPHLSPPIPLAADHDLSAFDCGVPALDEWLRHRALKNESRFSRTYVVCEADRVVAYYCISAGAVRRSVRGAAAPGGIVLPNAKKGFPEGTALNPRLPDLDSLDYGALVQTEMAVVVGAKEDKVLIMPKWKP